MRSALAIFGCALLLAGCESYGDLTSDAFDPGNATVSHFTLDSAQCAAQAENTINYQIRGIAGTHVERHEMYNRAYAACMQASGYARRDWSPDIPIPYKIDPIPG